MQTFVPLLRPDEISRLPERAREVVEYRKSGLSLNHVVGCPLDCAYCIRHTYGVWDQRVPKAIMPDGDAVAELVGHRYFQPHVTPIQVFNRATDPFLPRVKESLFAVLADLDARRLTNHVLVITRHQVKPEDCTRLDALRKIRVTLLFTYSGIADTSIEPFPSHIAARSLHVASTRPARRYRTILYWRPLVPGLNDSSAHLADAVKLSRAADATVFTGLFYRDEIAAYYRQHGLTEPYSSTARRKIVPETLEQRVLAAFRAQGGGALFRKTSCAVSYAHNLPDYNGHYGIRELCDICPLSQVDRCRTAHRRPMAHEIVDAARSLPGGQGAQVTRLTDRAAVLAGLNGEQARYYLQHRFAFQMHDVAHPHHRDRHGRADIGWSEGNPNDE
ncbi:radical SAM protein [Jiangella alba]|uniref:DNA repair photolyase n=1 Tax=Jiangella alba TaxID=561176 RepID=A0A1H5J7W7_9ACTN|nr:radical SAM protein [Jiangella alba]SEE48615.1 hypothetical protein SAMN04488561_1479 [Jiangella alba]